MELISFMLIDSDFYVLQNFKGCDGFDVAKSEKLDLILVDIQLPDIDGTVILRNLLSDAKTFSISVFAATSYAMTGECKKLLKAGCDGYIEKPIEQEYFVSQITSLMIDGADAN